MPFQLNFNTLAKAAIMGLYKRPDHQMGHYRVRLALPLGRLLGFHALSAARRAAYVASGSEDIDLK